MPVSPATVEIDGVVFSRSVMHRCKNIGRHVANIEMSPGCACHPKIPQPCPDCYAIESLTRRVPWSWLGREPQSGAQGTSSGGSGDRTT